MTREKPAPDAQTVRVDLTRAELDAAAEANWVDTSAQDQARERDARQALRKFRDAIQKARD